MYNINFTNRNNYTNNHNNDVEYKYTGTYRDLNNNDILAWKNNNIKTYSKQFYDINIKNIKIYCLTIDENHDRRKNIHSIFTDISINYVYTNKANTEISKFQSGAIGMSKIFDSAIHNFKNKDVFEPFIIIEDDVKKTINYCDIINIPSDSDMVYIGISPYGFIDKPVGIKGYIYGDNIIREQTDISYSNVIKIKNMLSTHAILINSFSGLLIYQRAMIDAIINNRHYDIPLALQQPYYNIYALRKPLMCQDISNGGQAETDIEITEKLYKSNIFVNHSNYILKNNLITKINN